MNFRRDFLKWVYPLFRKYSEGGSKGIILVNKKRVAPVSSLYSLTATSIAGEEMKFSAFEGKYILIVNTASDCGFTPQYRDLQKLQETNTGNLVVIGFPSNDFKGQEPGTNEQVAEFCKTAYGISFPLVQKSVVKNDPGQHPVYQWLSNPAKNGWNSHLPDWNFSKYMVDPNGVLTHYFGPAVTPAEIQKHLVKPTGQS